MKGLKLAGAASAPLLIALLVGAPSPADAKGPKGPNDIGGVNDVVPRIGNPGVGNGHGHAAKANALGKVDVPSVGNKTSKKSVVAVEAASDTGQPEAAASSKAPSSAKPAPLPACI